ncbi:MAG: hypothetical protein IAI50_21010, partial [Candidatus Eremiobacteraeota bacterium]|nr:hypothetical protein [Candidatus Eremiobacteraeota bacterium]
MTVAATLGFAYSYLGPEDAVALSRAGVTVVIRPGERLFDVNDRTEAMEGAAPRFSHSDVYISDALFARLRQLAILYPAMPADRSTNVAWQLPRRAAIATGSISALSVSQVSGQQEIAVGGKAPPNLPITITLVSTFSTEVPNV